MSKKWKTYINSKFIFIILGLILSRGVKATPELDVYSFEGKHISVSVIYRYNNDIEKLYYKSLTENLNEYIAVLKQDGKLDRGKINFQIMTAAWMDHSIGVEMYRYKNGYYCFLNGLHQTINQDYLIKIINYFASDTWESFCYDETKITPQKALYIFNRRLEELPELTQLDIEERKIFDLSNISLYFQNDSLICKNENLRLGKIEHILPFSAKSKDFITIGETIYVIENNKIINTIKLSASEFDAGRIYESPWIETFPKWVNFRNREGYFLSYSIDNNLFYRLSNCNN